jgi:hypothetical protein
MPEAERLATLQLLDANKAEVEARLAALPIIIETPSAVRHPASACCSAEYQCARHFASGVPATVVCALLGCPVPQLSLNTGAGLRPVHFRLRLSSNLHHGGALLADA